MISSILLNQYDEWPNNYSTSLQRNYKPNINIFFFANHFPQIAFKSGKSAKDLAVAFIRRTTGTVFGTLIGFLCNQANAFVKSIFFQIAGSLCWTLSQRLLLTESLLLEH
jgi:hypothetical protein